MLADEHQMVKPLPDGQVQLDVQVQLDEQDYQEFHHQHIQDEIEFSEDLYDKKQQKLQDVHQLTKGQYKTVFQV